MESRTASVTRSHSKKARQGKLFSEVAAGVLIQ